MDFFYSVVQLHFTIGHFMTVVKKQKNIIFDRRPEMQACISGLSDGWF